MFFDIGWPELMLIGAVALVVIGPKDLPRALRVAGYWVRKARTLSREFQSSVDQMIREAELDEMRQELKKATEIDIESEFRKTVDPDGSLAQSIRPPNLPDYFDHSPTGSAAVASPAPEPAAPGANPPEPLLIGFDDVEPLPDPVAPPQPPAHEPAAPSTDRGLASA
jgi:sec-independent protein translocase protein TatB